MEEDRDALCALRTADSAIDKLLDPAFADYVVLANAGTTFTGRYMQIDGKKYNERLWCHKDGILDKKHTGLWYNDGQWRIGQTSNHWWTNATDPPLSGQWHGWEAGRHNLGGLPKFEATIVKRVEEDERVTALRLDWCSGIVTLPVEIFGLRALTTLSAVGCSGVATLPDAINGLQALTTLSLEGCTSLAALPDAIGDLKALTYLNLRGMGGLTALPDAFVKLKALKSLNLIDTSLTKLPAAIGELGALTHLLLSGCNQLKALPKSIEELKALKVLDLSSCSSLIELPDEIGDLGALTHLLLSGCNQLKALPDVFGAWFMEVESLKVLDLSHCSSLTVLPDEIGGLDTLMTLGLDGCSSLTFPPLHMHGDANKVIRCLASVEPIINGKLALEEAGADEREFFFADVLKLPVYADRLGARVRKDPAFADVTNARGQRVFELACLECREQMQKALFLLGRYAVDKTPPLHFSATAAVMGSRDHECADTKPRRALKAMRRVDQVLAELEGREGLDAKYVVAVVAVHVNTTVADADFEWIEAAARKLDGVVVSKATGLGGDLAGLLAERERSDASTDRFMGYDYLLVMELAEESLSKKIIHGGVCGVDLFEIRKIARDLAEALAHLHAKDRIHADLKPLNVVRVGTTWQLVDLDVSCEIGKGFGSKKPSLGYCPPEMAKVLLGAMDAKDELDTAQLSSYKADIAYDLWSYGVVLFQLATGTPLFKTDKNDDTSPKGLRKLVKCCFDADRKLAIAAPKPMDDLAGDLQLLAFDLIRKLLEPEPVERYKHFSGGGMHAVLRHGFFSNDRGGAGRSRDDKVVAMIEDMRASQAQILRGVNAVRDLGEQHRDELRATGKSLRNAIFEAAEVRTPTAFVVLKEKLPTAEEDEQLTAKFKEDGKLVVGGAIPDEVTRRWEQGEA